jgi:hypothetical protein
LNAPKVTGPWLLILTLGGAIFGALVALWFVMAESIRPTLIVIGGVLVGTTLATVGTTLAAQVLKSFDAPSEPLGGSYFLENSNCSPGNSHSSGPGGINRSTGSGCQPRDNMYASGGGQEPASQRQVTTPPPMIPSPVAGKIAVLPLKEQGGEWWSATSPAMAGCNQRETAGAPPLDLSGYVESARVVQCPSCASFRINVRHVDAGYSFSCQRCGHKWDWQSNTPWPKTIKVSRRLRADPVSNL